MAYLRLFAQRYKFVWTIFLALALTGVQAVNVHLDIYDHHHHAEEQTVAAHAKHGSAHICSTGCTSNHHDNETVAELDITPEVLVKKLSFDPQLAVVFIAILIFFTTFKICRQLVLRREIDPLPRWRSALCPPLRAPPR